MLTADQPTEIGVLGYVARASGLALDARRAHPFTSLDSNHEPVRTMRRDVMARFQVRVGEFDQSIALVSRLLDQVEAGRRRIRRDSASTIAATAASASSKGGAAPSSTASRSTRRADSAGSRWSTHRS